MIAIFANEFIITSTDPIIWVGRGSNEKGHQQYVYAEPDGVYVVCRYCLINVPYLVKQTHVKQTR